MPYQISIQKRAIKALENIPEPCYSNIRIAMFSLAENPRLQGYKSSKPVTVIAFELEITALFMRFLIKHS